MDPTPGSLVELPILYRTILDLVEELERCDGRAEAARIRHQALAAYGGGWDARQRRHLEHLEGRLRRSIQARRHPPHRWLRLP